MRSRLRIAAVGLLVGGVVAGRSLVLAEEIGSWVLECPVDAKGEQCRLRHQTWILPPATGGPSADLEILHRGNQFLPVIALRGLSMQAALGGVLALQANVALRFDNSRRIELSCGLDSAAVICVPAGADAAGAASQLAAARAVLVQVQIGLPGGMTLPQQTHSFELQRTRDALSRFRDAVPAEATAPALPGLDLRDYLDRLLRGVGLGTNR
jgi:hypothetical protein